MIDEIIERTDGIPLFVEELTKAVLEAAGEGNGANIASAAPLSRLAVPASLHASLMARLDRLGASAREISQVGAAIGREFSHELLAPVAQKAETELHVALDRLTGAGLVLRRGIPPQATYLFKHALVRDAAYGSLLRSQRRLIHGRIVGILEAQFPETVAAEPALLAQHCTAASLTETAIGYWLKAARQAMARSAMVEAIALLHKGLELTPGLPDGASRQAHELDLQIALGQALIASKGYTAPETVDAYARARELSERLGGPPQIGSVIDGQFNVAFFRGDLRAALRRPLFPIDLQLRHGVANHRCLSPRLQTSKGRGTYELNRRYR